MGCDFFSAFVVVDEDFGFFTGAMKEKEFLAGCGQLGDAVLSRVRLA